MTLQAFRNPHTGTLHLLKTRMDQKTLKYPDSPEFHARSYCGVARFQMREGDIEDVDAVLDPDDYPTACKQCLDAGPVICTQEPM